MKSCMTYTRMLLCSAKFRVPCRYCGVTSTNFKPCEGLSIAGIRSSGPPVGTTAWPALSCSLFDIVAACFLLLRAIVVIVLDADISYDVLCRLTRKLNRHGTHSG